MFALLRSSIFIVCFLAISTSQNKDDLIFNKRDFVKEFTVETKFSAKKIKKKAEEHGMLFDCIDDNLIKLSFTEKRTKNDIDVLVQFLKAYND